MAEAAETHIEWAVQYRAYLNGRFERTVPYEDEGKARRQVEQFNAKAAKGADCRLASRRVTKWQPT